MIYRWHRDDIKVLPYISQIADNINKNNETENDTKQSNIYCIEDYEDFHREMQQEYCDFDNNFLFQDSHTSTNKVPSYGETQIDNITQHRKSKFGYPDSMTVTNNKKTKSSIL